MTRTIALAASMELVAIILPTRPAWGADSTSQPGVKTVTIPDCISPAPAKRGTGYSLPVTKWERRPILWGWACELPDGSGIAFGGIHQTADDGNPHTSILVGGEWKPIIDELPSAVQRKFNPQTESKP